MEYRFLGRSGVRVGVLALGTLTFGRETPEAESHRLLVDQVRKAVGDEEFAICVCLRGSRGIGIDVNGRYCGTGDDGTGLVGDCAGEICAVELSKER